MAPPQPHSNYRTMQERRLSAFTNWASSLALSRVIFLHASVISSGFGVLFLPVAFLDVSSSLVGLATGVALALTVIHPVLHYERMTALEATSTEVRNLCPNFCPPRMT